MTQIDEKWHPLAGYEGLYQVTKSGKVKRISTGRVLKHSVLNMGYVGIRIKTHSGKWNTRVLHRLLAQTFIPNPDNLPWINHIDGNKKNFALENLEWCTHSHNMKEAFRLGLNKFSDEQRRSMSERMKGKPAWNKGIPHSESTKEAIKKGVNTPQAKAKKQATIKMNKIKG